MPGVDVQFKHPPVQRMRLAFHLLDEGTISPLDLDGLRAQWRPDYPLVTQLAPIPGEDDERPLALAAGASKWPLPFTVFEGPEHGRRILLQNDRFALEWEFGPEESRYPSYASLRQEFMDRYAEFRACLKANGLEDPPKVEKVEAFYVNNIKGMAFRSYLSRVFLESQHPVEDKTGVDEYFSRHYHWKGNNPCWVTLSSEDTEVHLRIRASVRLAEPKEEAISELDECHEEISSAFWKHTTDEMRESWT
jgi:uncharacterized protein (TIGR04255 family)